MKEWVIEGNKVLNGEIKVEGSKNALLAIIPACIITKSIVKLTNVTPLFDTYVLIDILKELNVKVIYDNKSEMIIDSRNVINKDLISEKMKKIRASYYFMGALLSLFKNVKILGPGGCKFASRPIDLHLFAFEGLGCECRKEDNIYFFNKGKIKCRVIKFKKVSVGATVNAILASCRMRGNIKLINVALEPEIDDLIKFLNLCGANICRENNNIIVKGVSQLHGCEYKIMEDRIEAGTYLILGACTCNSLKIIYHEHENLIALIELMKKMNVNIKVDKDFLIVNRAESISDSNVVFDSYPSLATDLQQPLSILLTRSKSYSVLKDLVYPTRYTQLSDLNAMGFNMKVNEDCLYIYNSNKLTGKNVECKDLRGGVSLVIAGLISDKTTIVSNVNHIERGYFDIVNKLKKIGARIYEKDI